MENLQNLRNLCPKFTKKKTYMWNTENDRKPRKLLQGCL